MKKVGGAINYVLPPMLCYVFYYFGDITFAFALSIFFYGLLAWWSTAKDELIEAQRELLDLYRENQP